MDDKAEVWRQAQEGLHRLVTLVTDEAYQCRLRGDAPSEIAWLEIAKTATQTRALLVIRTGTHLDVLSHNALLDVQSGVWNTPVRRLRP